MFMRLAYRESYRIVLLRPLLPQILLVYWLSLSSPRSVLIIVSTFLFNIFGRTMISYLLLSVVASIEEFAERYSVPKPFIGLILLPIVVSEYILFSCLVKYPFNLGKCSRACHFHMDGYEKPNGTYNHYLRWKLDCEFFLSSRRI